MEKDEVAGVDSAWKYLDGHRTSQATADIAKLRHKIDWHIVPLLSLCYLLQFLDKVIYNYAGVMGISAELHLKSNDFSNIATFFFVGYLCFEAVNVVLLQKVPVAKWLSINMILWGLATACSGGAKNYRTLLVSRVFVGMFEATAGASLSLITSQWYTKSEAAPRFTTFYLGVGFGQIFGGAISYGFQHVGAGAELSGWRIMFITLGCLTIALGIVALFFLPDTPMQARWLSDSEKVTLLRHVSVNQTGIENRAFRPAELVEALTDPQIYLLVLACMTMAVSSGVINVYSSTIIKNLGYTNRQAALLNMPSGAVSVFYTISVGYGIRKSSHRWAWIIACLVPGIMGGALMSFLPKSNRAGVLAGVYLVNAIVPVLAIIYNWMASNVSGYTKRAFAAASIAASFGVGSLIGPQTFQARDAPEYRPAKIAVLGTQAGCAFVSFLLFLYYRWENKRREHAAGDGHGIGPTRGDQYLSPRAWAGLTDRQNKEFRYVY